MKLAILFALSTAACALTLFAADKDNAKNPGEKRELLAEHQTLAKLKGIAYQRCMGLTALCPDNCGHSGDFATFDIQIYIAYQKPGQYGDEKTQSFVFQIEDNHKNLKVSKELAEAVRALQPGDYVLLDWKHEYVTKTEAGGSSSYPERPITKLTKISNEEAEKLMKK